MHISDIWLLLLLSLASMLVAPASAQRHRPNILIIMGDDIRYLEHQRVQPRHDGLSHIKR